MKFLSRAATVLSAIFSPLLMATYGVALAMVLSFLCFIPTATKLTVIFETLLATVAIPVIGIFVLYKVKVITDPKTKKRILSKYIFLSQNSEYSFLERVFQ